MPYVPKQTDTPARPGALPGMGMKTISIVKHQVDINAVFRTLFGREPDIDAHTGEIVYVPNSFKTAPTHGGTPNAPPF